MRRLLALAALVVATPAWAQTSGERDYCPERPGLDTPPCIVDKGHVSVETGLADWTRDDQPDQRTDTILIGDTQVRIGVTDGLEVRIGWTPFGHERERDKAGGGVTSSNGVGDLSFGFKASLAHPGGDGLSIAVLPFATAPIGHARIGAGDWGAGVLLPVSYSLSDAIQLAATPEVDAAVNEDGSGRHLAYSGTAGIGWKVAKSLTVTGELQVQQDDDPSGASTPVVASLSLAWAAGKNLQFDVGGIAGLNHDAADAEVYAGIARRF